MQVTFYHRRPQGANFSFERFYADVRAALPEGVCAKVFVSRFPSRGFWPRVYNVIEAVFHQGDVNHITGDVHILALLLHSKRTLLTIADLVTVHRLKGFRRVVYLFFWYWLPIRRSALVTVISESTKEELLNHIKVAPQKVRVVHCCVTSAILFDPKEFNSSKPVILQIGTGHNKNVERLAEALDGVSCHLRIIGVLNAEQKAVLHHSGVEYSFTSNISDGEVVKEYQRCDMLVFASTYEGFGLPIIEAQATGRPVVTSNILSMPEVAGEAACLVDPFNVQSIRVGIQKIIHDSMYREELVTLGLMNVVRFRSDRIAAHYSDIYRELCGI